jgi:hypothetical protein
LREGRALGTGTVSSATDLLDVETILDVEINALSAAETATLPEGE